MSNNAAKHVVFNETIIQRLHGNGNCKRSMMRHGKPNKRVIHSECGRPSAALHPNRHSDVFTCVLTLGHCLTRTRLLISYNFGLPNFIILTFHLTQLATWTGLSLVVNLNMDSPNCHLPRRWIPDLHPLRFGDVLQPRQQHFWIPFAR